MSQLIVVPKIGEGEISIIPAGEKIKQEFLAEIEQYDIITTNPTRDEAIALAGRIRSHLKAVEESREAEGGSFFKVFKAINAAAKKHTKELEDALALVEQTIGAYNAEQADKLRKEQQRIQKEIDDAKAEADRKAREAEAAAADMKQSNAPAAQALEAELDAEDAAEQAAETKRKLDAERIRLAEVARRAAPAGGNNTKKVEVEVTDVKALYAARPDCVKLVPDIVQIKYLDAQGVKLPGVIITKTPVYRGRAA